MKRQGISVAQLSAMSGVPQATIYDFLRQDKLCKIDRLCKALKIKFATENTEGAENM